MRILHAADWQIGMKAVGWDRATAGILREGRFWAAERVVDEAKRHKVGAIIVAGEVLAQWH